VTAFIPDNKAVTGMPSSLNMIFSCSDFIWLAPELLAGWEKVPEVDSGTFNIFGHAIQLSEVRHA